MARKERSAEDQLSIQHTLDIIHGLHTEAEEADKAQDTAKRKAVEQRLFTLIDENQNGFCRAMMHLNTDPSGEFVKKILIDRMEARLKDIF